MAELTFLWALFGPLIVLIGVAALVEGLKIWVRRRRKRRQQWQP